MRASARLIGVAVALAACSPGTTSSTDAANSTTAPTPQNSLAPAESTTVPQPDTATTTGVAVCWSAAPPAGSTSISFSDITAAFGLVDPLTGMHGHAAAWGDLDGDGGPDLVVGTFANRPTEAYQVRGGQGPSPDRLLSFSDSFTITAEFPELLGRTSGAAIADLDNDGDNDVVLSRNMRPRERSDLPTQILRNDEGVFTPIDINFGRMFSGRSIGLLDYNRDGWLDLFVLEDRFAGGKSSVLLKNLGGLEFEDVTVEAGIPEGVHGLGIATSDLNGDGLTDVFVGGSNRLFIARDGGFQESNSEVFQWTTYGNEDDVAGASIADLNRDGRPDLVVGQHYNSTLSQGQLVPVRVYLNRGNDPAGLPTFEDVTEAVGMVGLPTKAPHVEVADFDNDGWPDILTTASAEQGTAPAVFRHVGIDETGMPHFEPPTGLGSAQYWVAGPTADVDHDGRLDVLLVEWEPNLPSLLMTNETASGNWLEVSVGPESGGPAIGSLIEVWEAGFSGDPDHLLGVREIVATQGYTAGSLQVAHFGLGDVTELDVRVTYPSGSTTDLQLPANVHARFPAGCRGGSG